MNREYLSRTPPSDSSLPKLRYSAFERIKVSRPVNRLAYLENQVKGKLVFDLGALDETAIHSKEMSGNWLHARLCASASRVIGIDNSSLLKKPEISTAENGLIVRGDIYELNKFLHKYGKPEVIVAGELIEHLPDTSRFLKSLKENTDLRGIELIVSTPNACCWHNFLMGIIGRESMHKDHLQIYSYKSLRTLFEVNEYTPTEIRPYKVSFPEMISGSGSVISIAARLFQGSINLLETITPILSAGWIIKTKI